jgi:plastocyanin
VTSRTKFLALPAVLALTAGALAAFGGGASAATTGATASAATASHLVTLKNIKFHPGVLHIARGDSVTWKWEDADIDTQHNVTSTGKKHFKSSTTKMSGTYTVRFATAGTYDFECTIHPASMQGKIIVK